MDAYALFDALTDVRDGFLEETERRLHGKKRRRVGIYLLAAVLIVLLCFSSAVALDADFRQRVLSLFQVCCDYVFAFAALGVAGFFGKKKNGLLIGYIVAVLARGFFHTLGGYLYWMDYMPENFPQSLKALYPIIYNYSYLLAEGVLTVILISLPPVKKALQTVDKNSTW